MTNKYFIRKKLDTGYYEGVMPERDAPTRDKSKGQHIELTNDWEIWQRFLASLPVAALGHPTLKVSIGDWVENAVGQYQVYGTVMEGEWWPISKDLYEADTDSIKRIVLLPVPTSPPPSAPQEGKDAVRVFNEDKLRSEIASKWGEHGAHMEVFDMILKRAQALELLVVGGFVKEEKLKEAEDIVMGFGIPPLPASSTPGHGMRSKGDAVEDALATWEKNIPAALGELLSGFAMEHTYPVRGAIRILLSKVLSEYASQLTGAGQEGWVAATRCGQCGYMRMVNNDRKLVD